MVALFGRGHHPNGPDHPGQTVGRGQPGAGALGAPFVTTGPRVSVAGYDLTFSPAKSVSALWALADPALASHYRLVAERKITFTKAGRSLRFWQADLDAYLDARTVEVVPQDPRD
jgi:hypothetical protein